MSLLAVECGCPSNHNVPKQGKENQEINLPKPELSKPELSFGRSFREAMMKRFGVNRDKKKIVPDKSDANNNLSKKTKGEKILDNDAIKKTESGINNTETTKLTQEKQAEAEQLKKEEKTQNALHSLPPKTELKKQPEVEQLHQEEQIQSPVPPETKLQIELEQLYLEEQQLAKIAEAALEQLQQAPLQLLLEEFAEGMGEEISWHGLSDFLLEPMKESIAKCRNNSVLANEVVQTMEAIKCAINSFVTALQKIQQEDTSELYQTSPVRKLLDAFLESLDLESVGISIDETHVAQKYPAAAKSGLNALCAVLEETLPSFVNVIDSQLNILKNFQKQHRVKIDMVGL